MNWNLKFYDAKTSTSHQLIVRDSLMVRMGACRVPDRGSIPRRGDSFCPEKNCSE